MDLTTDPAIFITIDAITITVSVFVFLLVLGIFVRRQQRFQSLVNVYGGLSALSATIMSFSAVIFLLNPSFSCEVRKYIVAIPYCFVNFFLFCHFFVKSRLLVGVVPEERREFKLSIKNPFYKNEHGQRIALRFIDVIFAGLIALQVVVSFLILIELKATRSKVTQLCTTGKDGVLRLLGIILTVVLNFMCLVAFVIPLVKLRRRNRITSAGSRSRDRQLRLVVRTTVALFGSIVSLLSMYALMIYFDDATLAPYYVDHMITQAVQILAIRPPSDSSKKDGVGIISTKSSSAPLRTNQISQHEAQWLDQ